MTPTPSLLSRNDQDRLDQLFERLNEDSDHCIGFPWNAMFDYGELFKFLKHPINNDGDPFKESPYRLNTHDFERDVINSFAQLTGAPADAHWGYMTSGGTEGNLYGMFYAREVYPNGVFYCSQETFSLQRLLRSLGTRSQIVRSHDDGCMDITHLQELLAQNAGSPAIILANIGTTLKGAVDDIPGIHEALASTSTKDCYIHADAALSGMVLPFVDNPPAWNFEAGVDSLSTSLHKMVGSPIPCGIVVTDQSRLARFSETGSRKSDLGSAILASRNAITPLFIWYALKTVGEQGFRDRVRHGLDMADYTISRLQELGWNAWRHPYSLTVVFDQPSAELTRKWQLLADDGTAHVVCMPHITKDQIDRFVEDMAKESTARTPVGGLA